MQWMMKGRAVAIAAAALATLMWATAARAQRPTGRRTAPTVDRNRVQADDRMTGWALGAHAVIAPGLSVTGEDVAGSLKTGFGPGAGVMVGYGFNQTWSAFASLDLAKQGASAGDYQGSFGLVHFEIGARANLPYGGPTNIPYVSASVGRRSLGARVTDDLADDTYDLSLSGTMLGLGGGIQHVISPALLIDGGMELGFGRFGHYDADGESGTLDVNGSTSIRLRFGVIWRPGSRRSA